MHLRYVFSAVASLTLAAALPAKEIDPKDPAVLRIKTIDKEIQRKIHTPCDDPLVADADGEDDKDGKTWEEKQWEGLGCRYLASALYGNWSQESESTDKDYFEFIANRLHAPPGRRCTSLMDESCGANDVQCDDTWYACGHLLLNSYGNIFGMLKNAYKTTQTVHDKLQDQVPFSFADTFAPELPKDNLADIIVGIVSLASLGVGTFADRVIKPVMNKHETRYGHLKDGLMLATGMSLPLSLNHLDDKIEGDTIDAQLANLLAKVYDSMLKSQEAQFKKLFAGNAQSDLALSYLTQGGAFISPADQPDWDKVEEDITKLFLGALIPAAWKNAPKMQNSEKHTWSNALFVNSKKPCKQVPDELEERKAEGAEFHQICYEGQAWYMMAAHISRSKSQDPFTPGMSWGYELENLPGDYKLFQEGGYHGLTAKDMLVSSVEGWKKGGKSQYWKIPKDQPIITGDKARQYELQLNGGVREPGFVQMLVCADWDEMLDTISAGINDVRVDTKNPTWPCAA